MNLFYKWEILQLFIQCFMCIVLMWLFFEVDFQYNFCFNEFQLYCFDVVLIGCVKWEQDSENEGKMNYVWYCFYIQYWCGFFIYFCEKIDKVMICKLVFVWFFDIFSVVEVVEFQKGNDYVCLYFLEYCFVEEVV